MLSRIGKESNRLEEVRAGLVHGPEEVLAEYPDPDMDPWKTLVLPVLGAFALNTIAQLSGVNPRTIRSAL